MASQKLLVWVSRPQYFEPLSLNVHVWIIDRQGWFEGAAVGSTAQHFQPLLVNRVSWTLQRPRVLIHRSSMNLDLSVRHEYQPHITGALKDRVVRGRSIPQVRDNSMSGAILQRGAEKQ